MGICFADMGKNKWHAAAQGLRMLAAWAGDECVQPRLCLTDELTGMVAPYALLRQSFIFGFFVPGLLFHVQAPSKT